MYTAHFTLHPKHSILYTTLLTSRCNFLKSHYTLHTAHCTLHRPFQVITLSWDFSHAIYRCEECGEMARIYCTALHCRKLYSCTVLHCNALYCTVLHCAMPYCTYLSCTALYANALHCTAWAHHLCVRSSNYEMSFIAEPLNSNYKHCFTLQLKPHLYACKLFFLSHSINILFWSLHPLPCGSKYPYCNPFVLLQYRWSYKAMVIIVGFQSHLRLKFWMLQSLHVIKAKISLFCTKWAQASFNGT